MKNQDEILHSPFDMKTHKENFINYLEVVILENGTIEYAIPSHIKKLEEICCKKLGIKYDSEYYENKELIEMVAGELEVKETLEGNEIESLVASFKMEK